MAALERTRVSRKPCLALLCTLPSVHWRRRPEETLPRVMPLSHQGAILVL